MKYFLRGMIIFIIISKHFIKYPYFQRIKNADKKFNEAVKLIEKEYKTNE